MAETPKKVSKMVCQRPGTVEPVIRAPIVPVDDEDLVQCVSCGLCLPHCPTYRVTGEEARSPRGRIAIIKNVQSAGGRYDDDTADYLNSCIQCRGCEPACPSGVPYGRIIAGARQALRQQGLATRRRRVEIVLRVGLSLLSRPRALATVGRMVSVAQAARLVPQRWRLGPLPVRLGPRIGRSATQPEVWIFTGCVMDVWMRRTHRHTAALVRAAGFEFGVAPGSCCGALHQHAGFGEEAERLARRVMAAMPGTTPIVVNSAGCGAALKEYGHLLGTPEAHAFAARVRDVHEWLEPFMPQLMAGDGSGRTPDDRPMVVLQDPCHLRHVQKSHRSVQTILESVTRVVTIDDDGLCCGAGGAFSLLEPELAQRVRQRKIGAIEEAAGGADVVVASANPGCSMFLAAAGLTVCHPLDILAEALELES